MVIEAMVLKKSETVVATAKPQMKTGITYRKDSRSYRSMARIKNR
jgi:hypothetical protein